MELITIADAGEMYEVDEFRIDYDPATKQYAWVAESGCSCWEGYDSTIEDGTAELSVYDGYGGLVDVHRALNEWAGGRGDYNRVDEGMLADAHKAIADHRP